MSKQLSVSAGFSIFAMAAMALFAHHLVLGAPTSDHATAGGSPISEIVEQSAALLLLNR